MTLALEPVLPLNTDTTLFTATNIIFVYRHLELLIACIVHIDYFCQLGSTFHLANIRNQSTSKIPINVISKVLLKPLTAP